VNGATDGAGMTDHAATAVEVIDPVWIPLSDGTRLCARIWRPASAEQDPVPAILEYLPYRKDDVHAALDALMHPYFAGHGYAAVRVDIRGSGDSDGLLSDEYSKQEHDDALEVIAWIAAQPWCSGAVGMIGISWSGFNSLQVAARRPPALKALITACSTDDRYDNDVHYLGGIPLACYMLPWASAMMAYNARPPDPAIVGERWREMWMARLEGNVDLAELWLSHQRRDEYWRHGSICEDYGAINCPVFAVGGWADAYVDAILRMLQHLSVPRLGLIGPWDHDWPMSARPGPRIGFLQEAIRWWDHWLKGADSGIMSEPMLRAWMQDPVPPAPDYEIRPGRWVAARTWPPRAAEALRLELDPAGLRERSTATATLSHCSPQIVGLDAGAWCAYGAPSDLPTDQRRDDGQSLSFDSVALPASFELLGQPLLRLRVASDQPVAAVTARLCDVAPDGASTLITRGVLNLCHRSGHAAAEPLAPGEPVDVTIPLKSVAYVLRPGHRVRLALSTSYWPWLWPSPQAATITVHAGGASALSLPLYDPQESDDEVAPFGAPVTAPPLAIEMLRAPSPYQRTITDRGERLVRIEMSRDFSGAKRFPSGAEYDDLSPVIFSIREDDPLSARVDCERRIDLRRGAWKTRVHLRSTMTADAENFLVTTAIDAYEGDTRVHSKIFNSTIPRDHA
jgi:putative CocE/NonD family hydrolase